MFWIHSGLFVLVIALPGFISTTDSTSKRGKWPTSIPLPTCTCTFHTHTSIQLYVQTCTKLLFTVPSCQPLVFHSIWTSSNFYRFLFLFLFFFQVPTPFILQRPIRTDTKPSSKQYKLLPFINQPSQIGTRFKDNSTLQIGEDERLREFCFFFLFVQRDSVDDGTGGFCYLEKKKKG